MVLETGRETERSTMKELLKQFEASADGAATDIAQARTLLESAHRQLAHKQGLVEAREAEIVDLREKNNAGHHQLRLLLEWCGGGPGGRGRDGGGGGGVEAGGGGGGGGNGGGMSVEAQVEMLRTSFGGFPKDEGEGGREGGEGGEVGLLGAGRVQAAGVVERNESESPVSPVSPVAPLPPYPTPMRVAAGRREEPTGERVKRGGARRGLAGMDFALNPFLELLRSDQLEARPTSSDGYCRQYDQLNWSNRGRNETWGHDRMDGGGGKDEEEDQLNRSSTSINRMNNRTDNGGIGRKTTRSSGGGGGERSQGRKGDNADVFGRKLEEKMAGVVAVHLKSRLAARGSNAMDRERRRGLGGWGVDGDYGGAMPP